MNEGLEISTEHTGKLKTKHKILLNILGNFLILVGRALKTVETYEQLNALGDDVTNRIEESEKIDVEKVEEDKLEETFISLNPPFLTYPGDGQP